MRPGLSREKGLSPLLRSYDRQVTAGNTPGPKSKFRGERIDAVRLTTIKTSDFNHCGSPIQFPRALCGEELVVPTGAKAPFWLRVGL